MNTEFNFFLSNTFFFYWDNEIIQKIIIYVLTQKNITSFWKKLDIKFFWGCKKNILTKKIVKKNTSLGFKKNKKIKYIMDFFFFKNFSHANLFFLYLLSKIFFFNDLEFTKYMNYLD